MAKKKEPIKKDEIKKLPEDKKYLVTLLVMLLEEWSEERLITPGQKSDLQYSIRKKLL